ncbi:hypothetical protein CR205_07220 [Alteribacter lacisalsi]|uniref:TcaA protein NTF2-like domain-containing protein n=1 Tax=Alteribacter lacisalsi TaxID=2045244 RepID=A0A2W0HC09_9BACI|nr:hypothetical protein [Alteribacter lacisalsi]PYZ98376.1 hypothetical protein CR205_07220 [Alteribacter lacisalsi]
MGKAVFTLAAAICLLTLTACADVDWHEADEELHNDASLFIQDYKEAWTNSLEDSSFRELETYLYPNSQFYHMIRRTHQQYTTQRLVEKVIKLEVVRVEKTDDGEVRITVQEAIEKTGGETGTEERVRTYYLNPFRDTFRITQMERQDSA